MYEDVTLVLISLQFYWYIMHPNVLSLAIESKMPYKS